MLTLTPHTTPRRLPHPWGVAMVDQGVAEAEVMERVVEGKLALEQPNLHHKQDLHQTQYLLEDLNSGTESQRWRRQRAPIRILKDDHVVATVEYQAMAIQDVDIKEMT